MIFEKNPFTTVVSMPKSFHLTPEAPTFEIHQPTLKGDGNDGEPDARRKLEFEKKAKIGWN